MSVNGCIKPFFTHPALFYALSVACSAAVTVHFFLFCDFLRTHSPLLSGYPLPSNGVSFPTGLPWARSRRYPPPGYR
jgi:hypothetical protein